MLYLSRPKVTFDQTYNFKPGPAFRSLGSFREVYIYELEKTPIYLLHS